MNVADGLAELTASDRLLLLLVADGHTNREIAAHLSLSAGTVRNRVLVRMDPRFGRGRHGGSHQREWCSDHGLHRHLRHDHARWKHRTEQRLERHGLLRHAS